eukprot:1535508-Ditylum_brightwellii.AAC.1
MGCWTTMFLTETDDKCLRILTAYRVYQDNIDNKQDNTAYKQQYRIMKGKRISTPNPKKQWCVDLEKEVKEWKRKSLVVLLCGPNSDLIDQDQAIS